MSLTPELCMCFRSYKHHPVTEDLTLEEKLSLSHVLEVRFHIPSNSNPRQQHSRRRRTPHHNTGDDNNSNSNSNNKKRAKATTKEEPYRDFQHHCGGKRGPFVCWCRPLSADKLMLQTQLRRKCINKSIGIVLKDRGGGDEPRGRSKKTG